MGSLRFRVFPVHKAKLSTKYPPDPLCDLCAMLSPIRVFPARKPCCPPMLSTNAQIGQHALEDYLSRLLLSAPSFNNIPHYESKHDRSSPHRVSERFHQPRR
jgi:hypothetical protein